MTKYKQHYANEDGWSDWIYPVHKGYKMGCCDCGLVHDVDFKVKSEEDGEIIIGFRIKRNVRASAATRKAKKFSWLKPFSKFLKGDDAL